MITILTKRIAELLSEKGWSVKKFAELVEEQEGVPADTVENICRGKTADPRVSTLIGISKTLGVSVNCLMGQCQHTAGERAVLRNYRACDSYRRDRIEIVARYEASVARVEKENFEKREIPCAVPSEGDVRDGIMYDSCRTEYIWTSVKDACVAIEMVGNELSPMYCKYDKLLFANRFPRNGEVAAFYINGKVYIKKFIEEDKKYILRCLHYAEKDMVFKRMDQVEYFGTCVGVIRT